MPRNGLAEPVQTDIAAGDGHADALAASIDRSGQQHRQSRGPTRVRHELDALEEEADLGASGAAARDLGRVGALPLVPVKSCGLFRCSLYKVTATTPV